MLQCGNCDPLSLPYSRHRIVSDNKTVCKLLKHDLKVYYSNQIPKLFSESCTIVEPAARPRSFMVLLVPFCSSF